MARQTVWSNENGTLAQQLCSRHCSNRYVAIVEKLDGKSSDWTEKVTHEQAQYLIEACRIQKNVRCSARFVSPVVGNALQPVFVR